MKKLKEEIKRSRKLMGLSEGLNLPYRQRKDLIDRVIEQIGHDLLSGDITALDELLTFIPKANLIGYLSNEEEWDEYKDWDVNNRPTPIE